MEVNKHISITVCFSWLNQRKTAVEATKIIYAIYDEKHLAEICHEWFQKLKNDFDLKDKEILSSRSK